MKYTFIIFSLLLTCGCHWLKSEKEAITPEEVAVAFSKAIGNLDYSKAAYYSEKETAKLIETMGYLADAMPREKKLEAQEKAKFIQAATCSITGNVANCNVCCDENGVNSPEAITLRLQDNGKWRVFIDKSGNAPGDDEAATEEE